ncbi:hypothetical protein BV25DRAFT_770300 [Artomyces pyxidatus]|uniref:Uncharacterized protein n=1 Tax=Artomyces pyxidatus TaxID=48021 RepID=A0ACB8SZ57_9AGAM|nr:hypothetical protein BV25DRAFT_770300 [Artomyces pyxidatus]
MAADVVVLRKCSRCKAIFYCSKDCQKTHWQKHRQYCSPPTVDAAQNRREAILDARCDSLQTFCRKNEVFRQLAPLLADIADAETGTQSQERHVLLVYADWDSSKTDDSETVSLSPPTPHCGHFIREAGFVPLSRIEQILDKMCAAESAKGRIYYVGWNHKTMKKLAPRPGRGWIPVLVIDLGIPYPSNNLALYVGYRSDEPRLLCPGFTL